MGVLFNILQPQQEWDADRIGHTKKIVLETNVDIVSRIEPDYALTGILCPYKWIITIDRKTLIDQIRSDIMRIWLA